MPEPVHHPAWNLSLKSLLGFITLMAVALLGYFAIYFWTYHNASSTLSPRVLLNQITVNTQEQQAKKILREEHGLVFDDQDFTNLGDNSSSLYRTDLLNSPQPVDEQDQSYYLYDVNGAPYFFDGETLTPLRAE